MGSDIATFERTLIRMTRCHGEHDARIANIMRVTGGAPPSECPVIEIAPGLAYHLHPAAFGHRRLHAQLEAESDIVCIRFSSFQRLGAWEIQKFTTLYESDQLFALSELLHRRMQVWGLTDDPDCDAP
jgi:hypothetical protein